jgi:hypothetical protein
MWILDKCHKIGLNNELKEKYLEKSKRFRNIAIFGLVPRIWNKFLYRSDKHRFNSNHLKNLPPNFLDDRHVIELAIFLKATLVTTDGDLKIDLTKWAKEKNFSIKIKSPLEVLQEEGLVSN